MPDGTLPSELAEDPTTTPTPPPEDIRGQAATAIRWSALSRTFVQIVQLVGMLALARLLTPADFGLTAVVLVFTNFAYLVSDLGLGSALIHSPTLSRRELDTAFWLNFFTGIVLTGVLMALSIPISLFYHHSQLVGLTIVASLTYTLSLTVVPLAILERSLNLQAAGISELAATVLGTGAGIVAAVLGAGAYSIVIGPVVIVALSSLFFLIATGYHPTGWIDRTALSEIWRYSRGVVGFNLVNYWSRNADDLLLGRYSGPVQLGYYSRAFQIMLVPVAQIQFIIGRVLFPALTKVRHDKQRLVDAHREALILSSIICAPLAAGMAACSNDFVLALFGEKWHPMVPILALLASTGVQQVFQGTVGTLYQTTGRTDLFFRTGVMFTILTLIAFGIGVYWGAIGMACAVAIRGWVLLPLTLMIPLRLIGDTARGVLLSLKGVATALVLEAAACLAVAYATRHSIDESWARLILEIAAGGVAYFIGLRLFAARHLSSMLILISPRFESSVGRHRVGH